MRRFIPYILLLVALLLATIVYRPGLHGPFMFDDQINIVNNEHLKLEDLSLTSLREAAFSIPNGFFRRPLSMLSFAINYYFQADKVTPFLETYPFKLTNLIIHLLNGVVLFALIRLLTNLYREYRQPGLSTAYVNWLALCVATSWLLHPLNLTGVLYTVQRMTELSALFTMLGLIAYLWGRKRLFLGLSGGWTAVLSSIFIFMPLAILSKENGALLPFFMLAAELTLLKFEVAAPGRKLSLIAFFAICAALPLLVLLSYLALHPDFILGAYAKRDFSMSERLMTEARVLWLYLRLILLPSNALMAMYHDDIAISHALLDPLTTLPAILGVIALLLLSWLLRTRQPLVTFGLLFFLVGHSMESTIIPLELAHEHRNYLPMVGILLAFSHLLLAPLQSADTIQLRRGFAILLIGLFGLDTHFRAMSWNNPQDLWTSEVDHHPASIRANMELGNVYAFYASIKSDNAALNESNFAPARYYYEQALALDKNNVAGLFGLISLSASHGKPVAQSWLDQLSYRLEHKTLPANVNDQLITLARCRMQYVCSLTNRQIESLLQAALRNQKLTDRDKVLIYSALTYYLFNVTQDFPVAIATMQRSIALAPQDLENRLSLVTILIAAHRYDEARQQLQLLKQLDLQGYHVREIISLQKQLPSSS